MTDQLTHNLIEWNKAAQALPWGVNQTLHQALDLVASEQIEMCYNADYRAGKPCLINAVGQQLSVGGGMGIPMNEFGRLVGLFDKINTNLEARGVNSGGMLSPMGADILLRNFGPVKDTPAEVIESATNTLIDQPYVEQTDEQIALAMEKAMRTPAAAEIALDDDFFTAYQESVKADA